MTTVMGHSRRLGGIDAERFAGVRLRATRMAPYLAHGIFSMRPVSSAGRGSIGVDAAWRLYVDPDVLGAWGPERAAASLVHHVNHLLRGHPDRARAVDAQRDPSRWNLAADLEIDDDIAAASLPLPPGHVLPKELELDPHQLAERYFGLLARDWNPCPACADQGGWVGPVEPNRPGGVPACEPEGSGSQAGTCGTCSFSPCGSGAGGATVQDELAGHVAAHPGIDDVQAELVRRKVAQDVRTYLAEKRRGTVPAGLRRWADDVLEPAQVPWQRVLAAAVRRAIANRAGQVDFTYRRPSRREDGDILLPAMVRPVPTVTTVVDTSSSMTRTDLDTALAEVQGITRRAGVRGRHHRLLSVDATASAPVDVLDARRIELVGGGGTDMRVGIAAACRLRPRPDAVVVLTDGFTPWPKGRPSGARVIIARIGSAQDLVRAETRWPAPSWATVVAIETSETA